MDVLPNWISFPKLVCFILCVVAFDRSNAASGPVIAEEPQMKKTLVFGATGKTGRHVVEMLLNRHHAVKAIVRSKKRMEEVLSPTAKGECLNLLETVECETLTDMSDVQLCSHLVDCDSVVCCLGKTSDIFSEPKRLVTDTTKQICCAIEKGKEKKKFVLMNTELVDVEGDQPRSLLDRSVLGLLGRAVPPHQDNEEAARYLMQKERSPNDALEWLIVRPTALVDKEGAKGYKVLGQREDGIFAGKSVAREAVGTFIADLVTNNDLWNQWKLQTPVVHAAN